RPSRPAAASGAAGGEDGKDCGTAGRRPHPRRGGRWSRCTLHSNASHEGGKPGHAAHRRQRLGRDQGRPPADKGGGGSRRRPEEGGGEEGFKRGREGGGQRGWPDVVPSR
ncbi:unnamed protein product, partial [Laminaria digitata]